MTLKQLREQKNLTQSQLGNLVGITDACICYYEKGLRIPTLTTMQSLAEVLEVDLQTIVDCFRKINTKEE